MNISLRKLLFVFLVSALCFTACQTDTTAKTEKVETADGKTAVMGNFFGEEFAVKKPIDYSDLATQMASSDSFPAIIRGSIEDVCQIKGCWMNIKADGDTKEPMMVQFVDYGFFMPLDCADKEVIMKGYAYRDVTSVDELKHYAEDAKASQEEIDAITEPKEELKFLASGVLLVEK